MMKYYILENKVPVLVSEPNPMNNIFVFAKFFEDNTNRIIQHHYFGEIFVSTVFLGIDHNFWKEGPPILFETMIFPSDDWNYYQKRYHTWDESVQGHLTALKKVIPIWKKQVNFDFITEVVLTIIVSLFFLVLGLFLVVIL